MTLPDPDGPTNPLPRRYTFTPDGLGRNTQIVNSITGVASAVTLVQAFDSRNNRTQLTAAIGSTLDFKNTYTYDALSRNVQIVQQGQSGGNTVLAKRVNLAYDAAGELQKLSRYSDTAGTQLVSTSDYAFDRLGRLTFLQHSQANREIASYRMAYDVLHRLTRLDDAIDEVSLYGYDTLGQLTTADHTFENDESYTYDANGNRTGAGYDTSVTNNQLDSDPNYNYTFDAEGNRASRTSKATGNIEEYAYDQRNRLTDVTFKNSAGTVVRTLHYDYDGFDRKVARKVGTASAEYYVYDGDDVALDFLDGDGTGQNPATLQERYLFGPAVDQVLAQENVVSGAGQTILWHLSDNLGSVRDLVRSDGTTAAHYQYDAFGNLLDGYEDQTRYQFTGRERDPDTGLQYNRARWYDPQSGQWMSEDPIGFSAGDANLRRYVGNGATNATDPSGQSPFDRLIVEELPNGELGVYYIDGGVYEGTAEFVGYLDVDNARIYQGDYAVGLGEVQDEVNWPFTTNNWADFIRENGKQQPSYTYGNLRTLMFDPGFNCRLNDSVSSAVTQARSYVVFSATIGFVAVPAGGFRFIGRGAQSVTQTEQGLVVGKHVLPQKAIDELVAAFNQAKANVKGTTAYGTRLHAELAHVINSKYNGSGLFAEVSYIGGKVRGYGEVCSKRVDILYGTKENPLFILDLKVGGARLTPGRIQGIRNHLPPAAQGIPIIEIHL